MVKEIFSTNEIKMGGMKTILIGFRSILVLNIEGKFFAIDNLCSHLKVPLSIGNLNGEVITCKAHGAQFNACTGKMLLPPGTKDWQEKSIVNKLAAPVISAFSSGDIPTYPVLVKEDKLFITLPD